MSAVAQLVAEQGTLLVVTLTRDTPQKPSGPPYPLSLQEVDYFQQLGLQEIKRSAYSQKNSRFPKRLRIEIVLNLDCYGAINRFSIAAKYLDCQ